jgi:hypothetical protein
MAEVVPAALDVEIDTTSCSPVEAAPKLLAFL